LVDIGISVEQEQILLGVENVSWVFGHVSHQLGAHFEVLLSLTVSTVQVRAVGQPLEEEQVA